MKTQKILSVLMALTTAIGALSVPVSAANAFVASKVASAVQSMSKQGAEKIAKSSESKEKYICPIDFESYQSENPDIYAWITIPGLNVDQPILKSKDDYYLKHTWKKTESKYGSIYTESEYNGTDFKDPVVVIYGHRMNDGSMFGSLQQTYSDKTSFDKCSEIIIYTPQKELHYKVFAALPYTDDHILYNYDFSRLRMKTAFFSDVFSTTGIGVNINESAYSDTKDGIVILSTCLKGNNKKRYLVIAQLSKEIS